MDKHYLEDYTSIKAVDKAGMLDYCLSMHMHYLKAAELAGSMVTSYSKPSNIIVTGMGGSAIGGELLKDWAKDNVNVPVEVNREYHLPAYAGEETLVLVTSYTGDTEETLSALRDAIKKRCMIYCITSGGTLMEIAKRLDIPYLQVPSGMPPRVALPYMLIPLLVFLEKMGLTSRVSDELDEALPFIRDIELQNAIEVPVKDSLAKTLAVNIEGHIPMIYGFGVFSSVARRLKQQINENAKMMSKWDNLPELNHNEIVGYEKSENMKDVFAAIFIRDKDEPVEIRSRIEITKELIEKSVTGIYEIWSQGRCNLAKMLSVVAVADFLSNYLAVLHGADPTPVQTIDKLKSSLKKNCIREQVIKEIEEITGTSLTQF
ncbi:MAG: bifunctional phosphoglucose/phosphomannose isomerase [Candidatus Bathyarchaeota archaeon]|nr:bifunctional phosphoglucose/phosphomannose isomerase [Candidatus Termiticorpusculum sp.]MCL1970503.1 bifunctional phosphoglucose/phosphomannose isomerase [Candidatus Termiticorpusculum sp.]